MQDLVEYIAKSLVDNPSAVHITEIKGELTSVLKLKVAKDDLGKVIGKQGHTVWAMRTILRAASAKACKHSVLEILE
ncbi:conserved hypothetical protein [Desulfovibrionales bacterium]